MTELATAWVTLAVSAKNAQRDTQRIMDGPAIGAGQAGTKAGNRFSKWAVAATNFTGIERKLGEAGARGASMLGSALKKGAMGAGAAVAGALGTSLALGFKRLSAIDEAQAKLRGLGHDATTISRVMDNALNAVRGTAFGLGDAAGLAGVIVASGIKPGKDLETVLKRVADSAAISGSSLGDMGLIWGKVAAKNKIDGEIVQQLMERQIPIYDILAKKMNVSAGEVAKMVSKGKVDFQTFSEAMADKVAGASQKTGETVRGSFDNMKAAMGRFGAETLKPGFSRLPGFFTDLTPRIDDATPAAGRLAQQFSDRVFKEWLPEVTSGLQTLKRAGAPVLKDVTTVMRQLMHAAQSVVPPVLSIGKSLGTATGALGISSWKLLLTTLTATAGVVNTLSRPLQVVADLMERHPGLVLAAAASYAAFRGIPAILRPVTHALAPVADGIRTLTRTPKAAGDSIRRFGDQMRVQAALARMNGQQISMAGAAYSTMAARASGAMSTLRGKVSGVVGMLGGPLGVGLMAAGAAFAYISGQNQKAESSLRSYQAAIRATAESQAEFNDALMRDRGSMDEGVSGEAIGRIRALGHEMEAAGERTGSFLDQFRDSDRSLWGGIKKQLSGFDGSTAENNLKFRIDQQAEATRNAKAAIDDLGKSQKALAETTFGGQAAFDQMVEQLNNNGEAGKEAAQRLKSVREEYLRAQAAASSSAPGVMDMADAVKTLGDSSATAAEKTRALSNALSALNPDRTLGDAIAAHDQVLLNVTKSTEQAVDASQGFGQALAGANGDINTATENGQNLRRALGDLVDASTSAVGAGQGLAEVNQKNAAAFENLAHQYGLTVDQIRMAFDTMGGRDLALTVSLSGANEALQGIGLVGRSFQELPDSKEITIKTDQIAGAEDTLRDLGFKVEQVDGMTGVARVTADTDDAKARLQALVDMLSGGEIPDNKSIKVSDEGGQAIFDLLKSIGTQVTTDNDKNIKVEAPLGTDVKKLLAELGYEVTHNNDKTIEIKLVGEERARQVIDELTGRASRNIPITPGRAFGAIVPRANGGMNLRSVIKPSTADIYAGRGDGTIFAEKETGGEAYIPMSPSKRGRSTLILSEVARQFGYSLNKMQDGGITANELKRFASQISGRTYQWGAGNGDTFDTDCSGAQSFLANFVTGGTGRFSTASASGALAARGFQMGDPPQGVSAYWVGWRTDGPGGGHMAGTVLDPYGGNVNVEMGGRAGNGQFGGSAEGANAFPNRAWVALASGDDPSRRSFSAASSRKVQQAQIGVSSAHGGVTSAQAGVDSARNTLASAQAKGDAGKISVAQQRLDAAEQRLTTAQNRLALAEGKLSDAEAKASEEPTAKAGGVDGSSLGQTFVQGILQSIGLDGSLFSNPLEWPNVKSAMGLLNFGGGMLKSMMGGGDTASLASDGGYGIGGTGFDLGGLTGMGSSLLSSAIGPMSPNDPNAATHGSAGGSAPGPLVAYNGTVNQGATAPQIQAQQNASMNMALRANLGRRSG